MIGQKKLVTAKRRTELLFPQGGGVALNQRMQWGEACGLAPQGCLRNGSKGRWRTGTSGQGQATAPTGPYGRCGDPVAFAGKRIGWQADPMRLEGCKTPPYDQEQFPSVAQIYPAIAA